MTFERSRASAGPDAVVERARQGDPNAQMELLTPYWDRISRLAFRMTGHEQDAQDLAQEAVIRIIRRLPSYRGDCAFGTWAYRIALNVCLSARAKRHVDTVDPGTLSLRDSRPGPEALALDDEMQARVRDEIRRLPPACRSAVLLRLMDELSYDEIADMLEISIGTARVQVHRGLNRLRVRLGPWMGMEEQRDL